MLGAVPLATSALNQPQSIQNRVMLALTARKAPFFHAFAPVVPILRLQPSPQAVRNVHLAHILMRQVLKHANFANLASIRLQLVPLPAQLVVFSTAAEFADKAVDLFQQGVIFCFGFYSDGIFPKV